MSRGSGSADDDTHLRGAAALLEVPEQHLRPDQPARRLHRAAQSSVAQPRPVGAVAVRGHFADVGLRQQRDLKVLLLAAGRAGG
jgi:hypothetical protein